MGPLSIRRGTRKRIWCGGWLQRCELQYLPWVGDDGSSAKTPIS